MCCVVFFQAEDGIRDFHVTGVQTCALPISIPFAPSVAISVSTRLGSSCGPHAAASLMPHETGDTATLEALRPRSGPGLAMLRARAVMRCMAGDYPTLSHPTNSEPAAASSRGPLSL